MQVCRFLVICLMCLLLSACVSTRLAGQLELGKFRYAEGNYKLAFRTLLPVAFYDVPQAEYAVGYMYYYGYGVPSDMESGIFWMNKAAAHNYRPAIAALYIISLGIPTCNERAITVTPALAPCGEIPPCQPDPAPCLTTVHRLESAEECKYGFQLFGAYTFAQVKKFQHQLNLQNETHIWHTMNNDKDWYVLTVGEYESAAAARSARNSLSNEVKELGPWIRNLKGLQWVI